MNKMQMVIVRGKFSRGYLPKYDQDLQMFKHCCEGAMEVPDIERYRATFNAHGWDFIVQDEA